MPKHIGYSESSAKRKVFSTKFLHKKIKNADTRNWKVHLKSLEKKGARISTRSRRKKIMKIKAEINQFITKKTI